MSAKEYILNQIKYRFGYEFVPCTKPVDCTNKTIGPLKAYIFNHRKPVLVKIKPKDGINSRGIDFSIKSNVLTRALSAAFNGKKTNSQISQTIESGIIKYYSHCHYKSAADLLRLSDNPVFSKLPAHGFVMPWENKDPEGAYIHRLNLLERESNVYKKSLNLDLNDSFREIQHKRIPTEIIRYSKLYRSIKENGYIRDDYRDGDITAAIMVGENINYYILSGIHRMHMLSSLGYKEIPVRIVDVIYRRGAYLWPQVLKETYTHDDAVNVFDNMNKSTQNSRKVVL
ncbi:MAG: hypothetical protein WD491_02785 [Balneolales bacterium]